MTPNNDLGSTATAVRPDGAPEAVPAPKAPALEEEPRPVEAPAAHVARASGLYLRDPAPSNVREELRLDVDGRMAQMLASGTLKTSPNGNWHWVARMQPAAQDTWAGPIEFIYAPEITFRWEWVEVEVQRNHDPDLQRATLRMYRAQGAPRERTFAYRSPHFRPMDFEFDFEEGQPATVAIETCAHPNHPATLACETLTVEKVFERAGFDVKTSPGGAVPASGAGANTTWSDREMHDAMQVYWSNFEPKAKWAIWVFFCSQHDEGFSLGGVMFDIIGQRQRQGTAIFNNSFISDPPPDDPNTAAWIERMRFWTAVHEMGHCFNLLHSWEKTAVPGWVPLRDEPEARSFMNYPFAVFGGEPAFFNNFAYRFSKQELTFMRHGRQRFVQPGGAAWADRHGFEDVEHDLHPSLSLRLRANRERAVFDFLEPITLELKLKNESGELRLVDEHALQRREAMTVVVKRDGMPAREVVPFGRRCIKEERRVLEPGKSIYAPLFVSAGKNGWDMAEPGNYTVQLSLRVDGRFVVSNPLRVRVRPPRSYEEEDVAGEVFTEEVGRIMALRGSHFLEHGNEVLEEVVERLPDRAVALHAKLALGNVKAPDYKVLEPAAGEGERVQIVTDPADPKGRELLEEALIEQPEAAVESFGHVGWHQHVNRFSQLAAAQDDTEAAARAQDVLHDTLAQREVQGSRVPEPVLREIDERRAEYRKQS